MSKKSMAARRQMQMSAAETRAGAGSARRQGRNYRRDARSRRPWGIIGAVVAVVAAFVIVIIFAENSFNQGLNQDAKVSAAPASLVQALEGIPPARVHSVGLGSVTNPPLKIPASYKAEALSSHGVPQVLYVGAEYCPYCATLRWALIVSLSQFGHFANLHTVRSSVYETGEANIPTFSFAYGAQYTSPYIDFDAREIQSNVSLHHDGAPYATLQSLNSTESKAFSGLDPQEYYPFVDFGGKVLSVASPWSSVSALSGLSWNQVLHQLHNPKSTIAQAVFGSANYITAAVCTMDGGTPTKVCSNATIQSLMAKIQASQ
ncbi:MAG: DUF929 family protein [Candidatus Dormibacteria bacterium]